MNICEFVNTKVDTWVNFSGHIVKVGEVKTRTKSAQSKQAGQQYNSQEIFIQDMSGQIKVWAYADKQFLPAQEMNIEGLLKEYNGTQYVDYATAVLCGTQLTPAPEPYDASQNTQQAPQQAAQPTDSPLSDYEAKEAERVAGMCRNNVVCAIIQHGGMEAYVTVNDENIEAAVKFIVKGPEIDAGDTPF